MYAWQILQILTQKSKEKVFVYFFVLALYNVEMKKTEKNKEKQNMYNNK